MSITGAYREFRWMVSGHVGGDKPGSSDLGRPEDGNRTKRFLKKFGIGSGPSKGSSRSTSPPREASTQLTSAAGSSLRPRRASAYLPDAGVQSTFVPRGASSRGAERKLTVAGDRGASSRQQSFDLGPRSGSSDRVTIEGSSVRPVPPRSSRRSNADAGLLKTAPDTKGSTELSQQPAITGHGDCGGPSQERRNKIGDHSLSPRQSRQAKSPANSSDGQVPAGLYVEEGTSKTDQSLGSGRRSSSKFLNRTLEPRFISASQLIKNISVISDDTKLDDDGVLREINGLTDDNYEYDETAEKEYNKKWALDLEPKYDARTYVVLKSKKSPENIVAYDFLDQMILKELIEIVDGREETTKTRYSYISRSVAKLLQIPEHKFLHVPQHKLLDNHPLKGILKKPAPADNAGSATKEKRLSFVEQP